ncbi:uncharacterized protein LOC122815148 [Protopterus annectens]|uniref:uncharacterized protein LOC122815148 n=1 Tax=Protopterus annectens TaxID=7888 RepID=UPI001CFAE0B2|nr:uncharacterized protein LOC122815148 [Protopterus annectens]
MASQICADQYDISKAVLNVNKEADVKEEYELEMKPNDNWETYLVPGPIAIAVLGELIKISVKNDFSINKNSPEDGYNYIRYPVSFRACLMHIVNEGYEAFSMVHKNMDEIQLHSTNIPDYIKEIVQILVQADDELAKLLLPDHLINIKDISEKCTALSAAAENKFLSVIHTVLELLEACVNAKKVYQEELKDIKNSTNIKKMMKALGDVKDQWEKIVRFFLMISELIKTCLNKSVKRLCNTSENVSKSIKYTSNSFVRDLIYQQALQACNMANLIHMISETYTEVSDRYIIDLVIGLGRLFALDPSSFEFQKLAEGCKTAQEGILDIVEKKKTEFENKTDMRVKKLETKLEALMPDQQIEKNLSAGMRPLIEDKISQFF